MPTIRQTLTATVAALALFGLAGCSSEPVDDPSPTPTPENGNGKLDAGESIASPDSVTGIVELACDIVDSGKITAVNAQQINGFGQYAAYLAEHPDSIPDDRGIADGDQAQELADQYIPLSEAIFDKTGNDTIDLPGGDIKDELTSICNDTQDGDE